MPAEGSEIGERLAAKLGIPCWRKGNPGEGGAGTGNHAGTDCAYGGGDDRELPLYHRPGSEAGGRRESCGLSEENQLYLEEAKIIWDLANQEAASSWGRCAGWVLKRAERCAESLHPCR